MDGIWIGIIIVGVLIVAFGPILYVLPSRKDRRLAALRGEARRLGLTVELKSVRNPDAAPTERVTAGGRTRTPMRACARYALALDRMPAPTPPWRLLLAAGDWIADEGMALPAGWFGELRPLIKSLPDDVMAVEFDGRFLACYWLERPRSETDAVAKLKGALTAIGRHLAALSAEAEPA